MEFSFSVQVFQLSLDEDAFDIAALLHKEFAYLMRENSNEENRVIVSSCV